jgi:SAM-dependent methyltransferase
VIRFLRSLPAGTRLPALVVLFTLTTAGGQSSESPGNSARPHLGSPNVIFVPTPKERVSEMLTMAEIKPVDIVYDLGCGDGRIVVMAAQQFGVKAVGLDIDPRRVDESLANARTNGVSHLVSIRHEDILKADFSDASVVMLFLTPSLIEKLRPRLEQLKPGTRIVAYQTAQSGFENPLPGVRPAKVVRHSSPNANFSYRITRWDVPFTRE